jgi:glycosyltransferase involved in cell wall biosynthesis
LGEELAHLYDAAELFVSLSWRESFPLAVVEAMSFGVPVVASRWGGAPEVVGEAGRLVDPRDTEGAKQAMLEVLKPELRADFSFRARAQAKSFLWDTTVEQTLALYRRLIDARNQ